MDPSADPAPDNTINSSSKHDWEVLSMSMSSSAFSVATPSSEPSSVAIGKDQIETSPLAPNPNPNPNPTDLHFAPVVDEGSSGSLQVTAALFSDLFHPPSSSDGVSDKIPEPFTEGWKPHLSVSATDFSYASEERRGHRHHHLHHSYADGDSLEGENESLALKKQNVRPSVYERESSSMASKADVFSATGGDVKELVVNESEVKLVQRAVKKKTKKKIYHKNGWWNETKISRAVWPMAMAAAIVGIAVIGRSWRHERYQNHQLRLDLSAKEEKLNDLLYQVSRLKDVLGGHHKVAVIEAST